jgi:hypothetical protein
VTRSIDRSRSLEAEQAAGTLTVIDPKSRKDRRATLCVPKTRRLRHVAVAALLTAMAGLPVLRRGMPAVPEGSLGVVSSVIHRGLSLPVS